MTDLFADFVTDEMIDRVFAVMALCPQHTFQVLTKRAERMRDYFAARQTGDPWAEAADEIADLAGMTEHPLVLEPRDIPLPNVWLGVSAERQQEADERIPHLLQTPAAVRFVSLEPLLGLITLDPLYVGGLLWNSLGRTKGGAIGCLDWVIVGGESGPHARPMHPDWARSLRDQCHAAGVAYFFKQWGEHAPARTSGPPDPADAQRLGDHPVRVGKKAAGRLLDGREWNEFPESRP